MGEADLPTDCPRCQVGCLGEDGTFYSICSAHMPTLPPDSVPEYQEWYEEWWIWDLPGRSWADVRYERMYDYRLHRDE
jgi:hypothetical protein